MRPKTHRAPNLETPRLRLRGLEASDLDAFQAMYSDPLVYSFLTGSRYRERKPGRACFASRVCGISLGTGIGH